MQLEEFLNWLRSDEVESKWTLKDITKEEIQQAVKEVPLEANPELKKFAELCEKELKNSEEKVSPAFAIALTFLCKEDKPKSEKIQKLFDDLSAIDKNYALELGFKIGISQKKLQGFYSQWKIKADIALQMATRYSRLTIIDWLSQQRDACTPEGVRRAFNLAAENADYDVILRLTQLSPSQLAVSQALETVVNRLNSNQVLSQNDNLLKICKLLSEAEYVVDNKTVKLERPFRHYRDNLLESAARTGHFQVVKYLCSKEDKDLQPSQDGVDKALIASLVHKHVTIAQLLLRLAIKPSQKVIDASLDQYVRDVNGEGIRLLCNLRENRPGPQAVRAAIKELTNKNRVALVAWIKNSQSHAHLAYKRLYAPDDKPEYKIAALLNDYTKNDCLFVRLVCGHPRRNHVAEVAKLVREIENGQLSSYKEILEALEAIPLKSPEGSLARRIHHIRHYMIESKAEASEEFTLQNMQRCS
ncbi:MULTISPECIES: DUF5617 domain-containing protein [unclassified Legionella]|uniref:DUF5617 domain-containing protein n=1 Tax=unclassified Legionella TaxID=2622702 RepID=UPI0010568FDE|nr:MULTISPECIES: DUF5617 domain-containing protein [unclassified Legionella]MDI9817902.1 DUF5617 domain-containing protein [Legionella sp. PL877]